ncbi:MAG: hypothetical protein ACYC35_30095, partial [Pirellulales bacterium]
KRMIVMATATLDLERETAATQAQYRALVARAAKGDVEMREIREICILSGRPMTDFERHTVRMKSRLEAVENMDQAHKLTQAIKNARADVEAAAIVLGKAKQKAAEIIAKASGPVDDANRRLTELEARQTLLTTDANAVLNRSRDRSIDDRIGRLNDERRNLENRSTMADGPLRVQTQKLARLQNRLAELKDDPTAKREAILLESEIAGVQRRIVQITAERDREVAVVTSRLPEIAAEVARLEASRLDAECMSWA